MIKSENPLCSVCVGVGRMLEVPFCALLFQALRSLVTRLSPSFSALWRRLQYKLPAISLNIIFVLHSNSLYLSSSHSYSFFSLSLSFLTISSYLSLRATPAFTFHTPPPHPASKSIFPCVYAPPPPLHHAASTTKYKTM